MQLAHEQARFQSKHAVFLFFVIEYRQPVSASCLISGCFLRNRGVKFPGSRQTSTQTERDAGKKVLEIYPVPFHTGFKYYQIAIIAILFVSGIILFTKGYPGFPWLVGFVYFIYLWRASRSDKGNSVVITDTKAIVMAADKSGERKPVSTFDLADIEIIAQNKRSLPVQDRERVNFGKPKVSIDNRMVGDLVFVQGDRLLFKFAGARDPEGLAATIRALIREKNGK